MSRKCDFLGVKRRGSYCSKRIYSGGRFSQEGVAQGSNKNEGAMGQVAEWT